MSQSSISKYSQASSMAIVLLASYLYYDVSKVINYQSRNYRLQYMHIIQCIIPRSMYITLGVVYFKKMVRQLLTEVIDKFLGKYFNRISTIQLHVDPYRSREASSEAISKTYKLDRCECELNLDVHWKNVMAANPRKFSEKIALMRAKEAEGDAAFHQILTEVSGITKTTDTVRHQMMTTCFCLQQQLQQYYLLLRSQSVTVVAADR